MHKEAQKERTSQYFMHGKLFAYDIDWNKEFNLETEEILNNVKNVNIEDSIDNDDFVNFCNSVLNGDNGVEAFLNSDSDSNKINFDLLLFNYGSYELVEEKILNEATPEQKKQFYDKLFEDINEIQKALIGQNANNPKHMPKTDPTNLEKTFLNFLDGFAPQMLAKATASEPKETDFINYLYDLKCLAVDKFAISNLFDAMNDFNSIYQVDTIYNVLQTYNEITDENDEQTNEALVQQIDQMCLDGVTSVGLVTGLVNLAPLDHDDTLGNIVDNIPKRITFYEEDNKYVSEDINYIVSLIDRYKEEYSNCSTLDLAEEPFIDKTLQLLDLNILSDDDTQKIESALDDLFQPNKLDYPDMSKYSKFINEKEKMDSKTARNYIDDNKVMYIKEGAIPAEYNEYMIASMLDEESEICKEITPNERIIMLESYARTRSEEMLGHSAYITYSNDVKDISYGEARGEHAYGIMKIVPHISEDQFFETVLNVVTINHELRHEWQDETQKNGDYNYLTYLMEKDNVLKNEDVGFYDRNYERMYCELDADYFALKQTLNYLETIKPDDFKNSKKYSIVKKELMEREQSAEKNFFMADEKKDKYNNVIELDKTINEKVKEDPDLLKSYPMLKVEYNDDGSKKSLIQMFDEYATCCEEKEKEEKNYNLYKGVLLSRAIESPEEVESFKNEPISENLPYAVKAFKNMITTRNFTNDKMSLEEAVSDLSDESNAQKSDGEDGTMDEYLKERYDSIDDGDNDERE